MDFEAWLDGIDHDSDTYRTLRQAVEIGRAEGRKEQRKRDAGACDDFAAKCRKNLEGNVSEFTRDYWTVRARTAEQLAEAIRNATD